MNDQPIYLSRKERREAERKSTAETQRPRIAVEETALSKPAETVPQPDIYLEPVRPTDFGSTANFGAEPVTASIIIQNVPDLDSTPIIVSETGGILKTGSIELPKIDPTTGSIAIVSAAEEADEAIAEDSLNSFVSSVAPLRAAGIARTRSKAVELTLVNRKGQGQIYAVMSTAVIMITVGALVVAAYLLGIF